MSSHPLLRRRRQVSPEESQRLEAAGMWLLRLQEDALTEAETSDWIEWCESDPRNLQAFDELRAYWQAAAAQLPAARKPFLHTRIPLWGALAASVALMLVVATTFFAIGQWPAEERMAGSEYLRTPVAENRPAVLPDGSNVEIGGRSAVEWDYTASLRKLQLREGEAFFQVKHDTSRPFVVEVADLRIRAVGTAFNVRRADWEVAVTVEEGVVELSRSGGAAASLSSEARRRGALDQPLRVKAAEQAVVDLRTGAVRGSVIDPAVALAWRSGRLEFTGDSLATVVASVNRYAAHPITLADPRLAELTFTGTVFFGSIDAWLEGLQQIFPVTVQRGASGEILLAHREHARSDLAADSARTRGTR